MPARVATFRSASLITSAHIASSRSLHVCMACADRSGLHASLAIARERTWQRLSAVLRCGADLRRPQIVQCRGAQAHDAVAAPVSDTWRHDRTRLTPCHICTGTGLAPATSAPGLDSPPATSAPGLGSPLPYLHRDWAHPLSHLHRDFVEPRPSFPSDSDARSCVSPAWLVTVAAVRPRPASTPSQLAVHRLALR